MSSVLKNYRKIYTSPGGDPSLPPRVTTLENNEYKVTYYEVIQGASGTLVVPSQGTINSDEFGLSGNAILSKIDANGKPTYESPTTSGGVKVTASLNVLTGAWVASGVYTDTNVALIYSIRIKAIYYSNLTYNNIIETIDLAVTKTSDLINDGDNGTSHFISLEDLPSNLILYATTAASDIPTYFKLVDSITDPSYDAVAANVSTGAITTTNQFISALVTTPNIIVGNPGILNISTIGNIRRTSGTGNAEFYFEVWKRNLAGTETLITTSGNTPPVFNGVYAEFSASALWNDGIFLATDRIVLKFYGKRVAGGSNPTYDFQFGGSTPVRSLVPLPLTVIPVLNIDDLQDVTIASVANNEILTYESSTSLWKNKTVTTALGYIPVNDALPKIYHVLRWFTPSSTVSSSGTTVTSVGTQFTSGMVNAKLTILGEARIITAFISSTQVTVASAYSTNYSGVASGSWGVYNIAYEITSAGFQYFYGYNSNNVGGYERVRIGSDLFCYENTSLSNYWQLTGVIKGLGLNNDGKVAWSSTNNVTQTKDLGLWRNSAGVLEINDGSTVATGLLANRRDLLARNVRASSLTLDLAPFTITGSNNTLQTASTAVVGINYVGGSRQWATGNITTQTENVWGATTYSFVGASTITNAYGNVFNAPIAGTNATITNRYAALFNGAIYVDSPTGAIFDNSAGSNFLRVRRTGGTIEAILSATSSGVFVGSTTAHSMNIQSAGVVRMSFAGVGNGDCTFADGMKWICGSTIGNTFGTATTQKLSFWNATPIVQPATGGGASTFVSNTSLLANDTATFDGYTIGQVVKALRNMGLLA